MVIDMVGWACWVKGNQHFLFLHNTSKILMVFLLNCKFTRKGKHITERIWITDGLTTHECDTY